jgi:hypothetical protein
LLAYALQATAAQVEERCRQIRNSATESSDTAQSLWERRSLSVWRSPAKNMATITVDLPLEEAELMQKALDAAVAAGEVATGAEFAGNSWRAQQVDALLAIAKAYLDGGASETTSAADHYQVVVHVDEKALRGGVGRSDLPIETIKRLTCDGSLITVVEDERGNPLDVGRKHRSVSTPLKRALLSRDRGCTFPGCHRTRFVDAHHIIHWANRGETDPDNLTLLCTYHHRLLHEGGFAVRRDGSGELVFKRADGRVIPRFGYQSDDVLDEPTTLDHASAEAWLGAIVNGKNPPEEGYVTPVL